MSYVQQSHFADRVQIHDMDFVGDINTYLIADKDMSKWATNMHHFFEHVKGMIQQVEQIEEILV